MDKLITRAYNHFDVDEICGVVRKSSSTERLRDEIRYYLLLQRFQKKQTVLFPRLLDYKEPLNPEYWMDLELYSYPNTGSYLFLDRVMPSWSDFFVTLHTILTSWSHIHPGVAWTETEIKQAANDMYIMKTEREFNNFYSGWKSTFESLFTDQVTSKTIILNNKSYQMFEVIWPQIKEYIENNMLIFTPSLIHGDCCFSNILYGEDKNIIRFIDPRGSFGKTGIYGDIRYDIAKLYHSVDGTYEAFITDNFTVAANNNEYELTIKNDAEVEWALNEFENTFFPQFNKKEIKIIQGCIFISMCARHYDNIHRQRAMYLTGTRLLNEALEL